MKILRVTVPLLLLAACSKDDSAAAEHLAMSEQPPAAAVDAGPPATTVDNPLPADPQAEETPAPPAAATAEPVALKYLIGDVDPASDPAFARIPQKYLGGSRVYGHKAAVEALVKMADAAAADGVTLKAVSAFRSFPDQKRIWEDKWTGRTLVEGGKLPTTVPDPQARAKKILEFSSMPGTSRHHWGTDFDFNNLTNGYFASGKGKKEYDWLVAHAGEYGFCQPYSKKGAERPTGYEEEKWHWSYLPVATRYLAQYPGVVGYEHLEGFAGDDAAKQIGVIAGYVQGINPACKR